MLDKYRPYKIGQYFFEAIQLARFKNDWDSFITTYGTHYINEVVFGGRAVQDS